MKKNYFRSSIHNDYAKEYNGEYDGFYVDPHKHRVHLDKEYYLHPNKDKLDLQSPELQEPTYEETPLNSIAERLPSTLRNSARLLYMLSAVFFVLIILVTGLAYLTNGGIFLLEKSLSTVTSVEKVTRSRYDYNVKYNMQISYKYGNEDFTISAQSKHEHNEGDIVTIYVSRINPKTVWFLDEGSRTANRFVLIALTLNLNLLIAAFIVNWLSLPSEYRYDTIYNLMTIKMPSFLE